MKIRPLIIAFFVLLAGYAYSAIEIKSSFGPARSARFAYITLAPAVTRQKACVTSINMDADANVRFNILDGNTTAYSVLVPSGTIVTKHLELETAICGSAETALDCSAQSTLATAQWSISWQGYYR